MNWDAKVFDGRKDFPAFQEFAENRFQLKKSIAPGKGNAIINALFILLQNDETGAANSIMLDMQVWSANHVDQVMQVFQTALTGVKDVKNPHRMDMLQQQELKNLQYPIKRLQILL